MAPPCPVIALDTKKLARFKYETGGKIKRRLNVRGWVFQIKSYQEKVGVGLQLLMRPLKG